MAKKPYLSPKGRPDLMLVSKKNPNLRLTPKYPNTPGIPIGGYNPYKLAKAPAKKSSKKIA